VGKIQYSFKRVEKKYMLTPEQFQNFLADIRSEIVEDQFWKYTVCNIYYDTPTYELIRTSIEKPIYKEKLRLRSYGVPGETDKVFAEIKKKYKGVVYKRRVVGCPEEIRGFVDENKELEEDKQIQNEIQWFMKMYNPKPKVFIGYDRLAFMGKDFPELRITFDENIRWRDTDLDLRAGQEGMPILPEEQVIMEIKVPKAAPLWLTDALSKHKIYPVSFSKYGTCYKNFIIKNLFVKGNDSYDE